MAANRVFSGYEALYARLMPGAGDVPELLFDPALAPRCEFLDLTGQTDPQEALTALLALRARTPFQMLDSCLSRPVLIKTGEQAFCYACEHFHLVMDAWGAGIVFQRIAETYEALGAGREPRIEGGRYSDHMEQCHAPGDPSALARALEFWRPLLAAPMPPLPPAHHPPAGEDALATDCARATLPRALADRVTAQIAPHRATLFHAVILAFNYLLAKQYGAESPPVSLPILNRNKAHKETIGFFVESRTLPIPLDEKATVIENLQTIARRTRELFRHYRVAPSALTQLYQSHGYAGAPAGLSSISYITRDFGASIDGCAIPMTDRPPAHEVIPFLLYVLDIYAGQDLSLELIHRKQHATGDEAHLLLRRLIHLLDGIGRNPQRPLGELDLIPPAERQRIAAVLCRDTEYVAAQALAPDAFLACAARCPDAVAIEANGAHHTYRECAARAQTIAHTLAEDHGVQPGDRVLMLLPRGLELVAGELGVMLAGAAFVPIDPDAPELRAQQIGEDAGAKCLLTISTLAGKARSIHRQVIVADHLPTGAAAFASRATPEQVAYIIYTSGSTGRPKGVEIPQREMADHCASLLQTVRLREGGERVLIFSSPAFDASIETIYPTLLSGGTLVMAPHPQWMPHELAKMLLDAQLTVLTFPAAYLLEFLKHLQETPGRITGHQVRLVLVGGDAMHAEAASLWDATFGPSSTLFNLYGPTEATVTATCFAMPPGYRPDPGETIPIGRPYRGRALRIIDGHGRDVPLGVEGELLIGGVGLAKGYHGMPEETAARFVTLEDGMRYYRSGDMVRLRADGQIVFRRRADRQIKIRGYRIEPGEIEACLHAHPAVAECAVEVFSAKDGQKTELRAYVALLAGTAAHLPAIRSHLQAHLPDHMIPSIALLDRLPKTSSGKIDRQALKNLPAPTAATASKTHRGQPPQGTVQEFLASLWFDVLGTAVDDVRADFFSQGGHSLLAARLSAKISRAFRIEFPFASFFAKPTLLDLAGELERIVGDPARLEKMAAIRLHLARLSPAQIQAQLHQTRLHRKRNP